MAAISNGTLAGLVPGIGLINAVSTAATAIDTFAKTTATANPTFDTDTTVGTTVTPGVKDGSVSKVEADSALSAAAGVRLAAVKAADTSITVETSTAQLIASKSDATTAAAAFKTAALGAVGTSPVTGSAAAKVISDFDAALAAKAALVLTPEQAQAASVAQAGAAAGVASALTAASPATTYTALQGKVANLTITTIGELYTALKADVSTVTGGVITVGGAGTATAAEHAALVAEVAKIPGYGAALVASAEKELAATKAASAVITTTAEVVKIDSDGAGAKHEGSDYTGAAVTLAAKTAALTAAEKGDVAVATAKAVVDQYTILNKAATDASTAIVNFNSANSTKFAITALTGATDGTAKQDVFYFPTKVAAANDFAIGGGSIAFGAGDSIVLGSGYTFNAGALTTGNATALEVFFVKGATGTQVVIETNAVGSATTTTDTAGTVLSSNDTAVINLVGVTADHLSFNNGVVSYV